MKLVLIGGGGHARAIADVARAAGFEVFGALTPDDEVLASGLTRLGDDRWIETSPNDCAFHVALGSRKGASERSRLFDRLVQRGAELPIIVSPSAIVSKDVTVGDGTAVMHGATINTAAVIGRNCIVNTRALVEHHCQIGDGTHLGPGSVLCGGVTVHANCIIGAGAVILPGVAIASGTVIGAGAVVTRSVEEPGLTWSGNPARRHE